MQCQWNRAIIAGIMFGAFFICWNYVSLSPIFSDVTYSIGLLVYHGKDWGKLRAQSLHDVRFDSIWTWGLMSLKVPQQFFHPVNCISSMHGWLSISHKKWSGMSVSVLNTDSNCWFRMLAFSIALVAVTPSYCRGATPCISFFWCLMNVQNLFILINSSLFIPGVIRSSM